MASSAFTLVCTTLLTLSVATAFAQTSTVTVGPNGVSSNSTNKDGKPCRVVESDDANKTGSMSSSVTAGDGKVHSSTTGGPSVTTRSGDGSASSTSSSSASSSSDGTTMTTTGDGDCVVTVPKGKK